MRTSFVTNSQNQPALFNGLLNFFNTITGINFFDLD